MPGFIYCIAAPSGAGKTSLVKALVKTMSGLVTSVSHTTRERREGESNGENYHFVTADKFKQLLTQNEFLEHAKVFNNYYGTSEKWVRDNLQQGRDVILEIDWQGALQVREKMAGVINIYILPPSKDDLLQRLQARNQDDAAIISKRMAAVNSEISHVSEFDYIVLNDCFDTAVQELRAIITAKRLGIKVQQDRYKLLILSLMK